jgi:23S rRNA pseudouridine1911/1915/1917 synthase
MLHAWRLAFEHPITTKQMVFEAPIPQEFTPWVEQSKLD